jgi:hypothetical protein
MSEEDIGGALEQRAAALEQRLAEMEAAGNARLVRAELKAEAIRAGMIDLDGLKMVDAASVTVDAEGEVRGAAALMGELRRAKPWLFGGASSSSGASAPPAEPPRAKRATEMGFAEWQAARTELLRRR